MNDEVNFQNEIDKLIRNILESPVSKKLIVAGPGTGKTALFKQAISHIGGTDDKFLALTFINNLEDELKKELEGLAKVYTFHGYCFYLLIKNPNLRNGLKDNFLYYPPLIEIIKKDWETIKEVNSPPFIDLMRHLSNQDVLSFFIQMGNYYNAVGYDDSIYRVYKSFEEGKEYTKRYKLIIVDEYQDFNLLETSILSKLLAFNPVLIAGDDDQALYCDLRGSDPKYIRKLFGSEDFKKFELPFCFRCPRPIVSVFNQFVSIAKSKGFFKSRIEKKFNYSPSKKQDSESYPFVKLIFTSTQKKSLNVNYFGRYIVQEIKKIKNEEILESHKKGFPTVLIIGPTHFLNSITPVFENEKIIFSLRKSTEGLKVKLEDGLRFLKQDSKSVLGWRIILESTKPNFYKKVIRPIVEEEKNPADVLPNYYIKEFTEKAEKFEISEKLEIQDKIDDTKPSIKLTTFEGAKGLSAQHVFVLGLQNGILPKNPNEIKDIDLCKFLVSITRSRKQCHILTTYRFAGRTLEISEFIKWLCSRDIPELKKIELNKDYWLKN